MKSISKFFLLVWLLKQCGDCAKILGIIPTASYSHQITFNPLWVELARRGHQVTVVTTDPMNNSSVKNLREIDLSEVYTFFREIRFYETISEDPKYSYFWQMAFFLKQATIDLAKLIIRNRDIKKLFKEDFDLVIGEAHFPSLLGLIGHFKCPWIGVSSMESGIQYNIAIGNPTHPIINPDYNLPLEDLEDLSFIERTFSFIYRMAYVSLMNTFLFPTLDQLYRDLGLQIPPLEEIQNNISMLFVTTHPVFHNLRPVFPNTVSIGNGLHFQKPQPLPKDLQNFLDCAKNGVIYFSLGNNVKSNLLTDQFRKVLIESFAEVPYKVLLKLDIEIPGLPNNVLSRKWMPQQDILRHKNVKLFITQGGLQSLQEAVLNGIPLIGIPFFGDQITNVNKMAKKGYGIKIDRRTVTKEEMVAAINEVIQNPKYKEIAELMSNIFRDEEAPSLQRAVYWTEYVIKHKGAKHLRSLAIGMPAWKYYMLDVIAFLVLIFLLLMFISYLIVKFCFNSLIVLLTSVFSIKNNTKYKKC